MPTVMICSQDDLSRELKLQIITILASAWQDDRTIEEQLQAPLHDPNQRPQLVVLMDGDEVLSYLVIPSTVIHVAGHSYLASGLSAVITNPLHRHQGYGHQIVTVAKDMIAASTADIGVFTCDPPLVDFYVRCGWTLMEHTSVIGGTRAKPFPAASLGKQTLMAFFSEQARQHRDDFEGAELFLELGEGELW